jgi:MFS family permease
LLFSLFGGVLADRVPKRRILMVAQSVLLVQALALAVLTSAGTITVTLIFVLAAIRGIAEAAELPTRQAFVMELVGPDDVQNAVALNSTLFNTARIVGPAIGGLIISTMGVAACFWLNTVSFVPVLVALALMRPREFHPVARPRQGPVFRQLGEGIRYAARTPDVALILGLVAVIGTFGYNFTVMLPLLARYAYGTGPQGLGRLTAALGVGSLLAAVYAASRGRPTRRAVLMGAGGFGVALLLVGVAPGEWAAVVMLAGVGLCGILFHTTANSRLQLIVPGELRGRVMSIYVTLFIGTTPIGSLIVGMLAARSGIRIAVVEVACVCLAGVAVGLFFALRMRRRVPNPLTDAD